MKLKHLIISVLSMAFVAIACTQEDDAPLGAPSISFEQGTLDFEKAGGDQVLEFTSTRDWTASCEESWVGLSTVTGKGSVKAQQITITADPNDSYDRSASIKFVVGDKLVIKNLIVNQAGSGKAPVTGIFYEANFKSNGFCDWEIRNVTKPDAITEVWTYNATYGLVATAYANPTNYASESWVVSPEISLAEVQSAHVNLHHAANYFNNSTYKNDITLWVEVVGSSDAPVQLEIPVYPSNSGFTYVDSGDIDLQAYVGKTIRLSFRYVSTATKAGTYEIDDLKISTEPFETVVPEIPDEGAGEGTAESPYDVTRANAIVKAGAASSSNVFVKGVISKIDSVDPSFGNATYYISKDGTETDQLEVYRGYYLNKAKFTSADQIKLGDEVVVSGILQLYSNKGEIAQGNYIYSLNGETGDVTPDPGTPETPEGTVVYSNDFDKAAASQTYGNSSNQWPFLDQFEGWKNEKGSGASTVSYLFKALTARSNSTSNSSYSNYAGSGTNNLFFGSGAYFCIKDITLAEGRNYVLTFGSEKYLKDSDSNFSKEEFKVYVSNDAEKWVALDYEIGGTDISGKWNINTSEVFTVGASDANLGIYFTASVASAYRLDDVTLIAVDEEGRTLDFSAGVDLGTGTGSGDDGGETSGPEDPTPGLDPSGNGTLDTPYNVAAALNAISALSADDKKENVYTVGIISSIKEVSPSYGNATYYISDDGTTANQLMIYRGYYLDGAKFTAVDQIKVGDKVVVAGTVVNFYGNTPEYTTGSKIISINADDSGEGGETPGEGGDTPGEGEGGDTPGEGGGDDTPADGSPVKAVDGTLISFTSAETASIDPVVVDFNTFGWANGAEISDAIELEDGTTITCSKGGNPDVGPKFYTATKGLRVYANNTIAIAASKPIAKIELTCDGASYVGNDTLCVEVSENTWTVNNKFATPTGGTQLRLQTLTIYYAE